MPARIIVAGIPGVGKTTLLQELKTLSEKRKVPLTIVNFGDVMNQMFKIRGGRVNRDHMRRQDIALQSRVQQKAARKISRIHAKSTVVVDTHMFVRTTDGIWPGTPKRVLDALGPDMIVLVEADPASVAKRRRKDSSRERESKTLADVEDDMCWSRYMASANAVLAGVPVQVVENRDGGQRQAAKQLLDIMQRFD